ncbi:MAG: class I SAM-dependent methyltransferase [Desulfobacterales bacterium]|nr:class I SAM-dependent methyltransferase [Desulfobacterales bacterium]
MNITLIKTIKGFLDHEEGMKLYEIAKEASKIGPCLEIGSYCGKSSIYLGTGCSENNGILFSIDHHRGSEEQQPGQEYYDPELFDEREGKINTLGHFRKTLELFQLENTVIPIVSRSKTASQMWETPLSLVFIDGGHTFEAAFTDYDCWAKHIMKNGYLLIHDIFKKPEEGGQAPHEVYNKAIKSGLYTILPMVKTLGILKKKCS